MSAAVACNADRVCEGRPAEAPPPRLLDRVRAAVRTRHYSVRTENAYVHWIRRYIVFDGKRHPETLGAAEIESFLSALAVDGKVAASTQNQALAALLFLYREVLHLELPWIDRVVRAKPGARLPTVLSREEVALVLGCMSGVPLVMATLLYGEGLRLLECARLRVKDVDFDRRQIVVRSGKGNRDRVAPLPMSVVPPLRAQLEGLRRRHAADRRAGAGWVELPFALARKLPSAGRELSWQWVFPASRHYVDGETGSGVAITFTRPSCSVRCVMRRSRRTSRSGSRATPSGIRSRRTCWRTATTSGRCRSSSAQGREHDDDLHARAEHGGVGGEESGGCTWASELAR